MSVNRIRAGTTSACQTCNLPVHCTLDAGISFGSLQDVYRHEPFFSRHYHCLVRMHKKPFAEIPLELSATPKRCLSKSDTCPTGNVFTEDRTLFAEFNPKSPFSGTLPYTKPTGGFSALEHHPVMILERLITLDSIADDSRYRQYYAMRLAECDGKPFLTLPRAVQIGTAVALPVTHGLPTLFIEGARALADARFHLILHRELTATVSIGLESELEEKTPDERKKERIRNNAKAGKRPTKNGWTKHTGKYQIKKSLTIEGEVMSVIGSDRIGHTKELKQVFTQDKNKLSLLDCIDTGFNTINNALQKGKGEERFPLLSAEFLYPKLEIEGSIKTDMSAVNKVINRGEVIVGFAPFFGFKITVDLITALAGFMKGYGTIITVARNAAATQEQAVKDGETGVYAIIKLDLMFSFAVHGFYEFQTDDNGRFGSAGRDVEIHGEIIGDAHIEAGVNVFGAGGFFKIGGEVKSTLIMGFAKDEGNDLTAVIYHEGIKARVYVKVSKGGGSSSKKGKGDEDPVTNGKYKEWIIYDKLEKKDSEWRFSLG